MIRKEKVISKRKNALVAVEQLIAFFERIEEKRWPAYFRPIAVALSEGNDAEVIRLEKAISTVNMGGFLDMYICRENGHKTKDPDKDEKIFHHLVGVVGKTITNLRVYIEYELDYPVVEI